jgi:hypothetical protein
MVVDAKKTGSRVNKIDGGARSACWLLSKEHLPKNYRGDKEICTRIEARAEHETLPLDQGGGSPLDPSKSRARLCRGP